MILSRMMPAAAERKLAWIDAPCPLCRGMSVEVVLEAQDASGRSDLLFGVVRCHNCRLHFTNPRPDEASMARFYPADDKLHHSRAKLPRWLNWPRTPEPRGRLFDFGTLPQPDLAPGSFDAVTMWHSLEHVHDPLAALRNAFRLLTPGGLLLVACPNIESAAARWFGADWYGLDLPWHLTHFSAATLREMLALAGFRVRKEVRGVKHSDWLRSSAEIAIRRGHATTIQSLLSWKPAAKIAAWLTYAFGASDCLLVIAERPVA